MADCTNFIIKKCLFILFHFSVLLNFAQSNQIHQKTFTKQDGIGLDIINSLCYDNDGFLWLGGSNLDNRSIIISERKLVLQRFNGHTFHNINLPDYKNPNLSPYKYINQNELKSNYHFANASIQIWL